MNAEELARRLSDNPQRSGQGWRVPCPAHGGKDPNLAISDGDKGGLLAFCHSHGCSYKDIMLAIEAQVPDFNEQWVYGDGRIQNRRPGRKFGGSPGSAGGPLLLHRDNPGQPIVICEGERTALAVLAAADDYTAASYFKGNPGAADFSIVKDRRIIVWPDNDKPGKAKGQMVAEKCHEAGAADVFVVTIRPEWPEKADAADLPAQDIREALGAALEAPLPAELRPLEPVTWEQVRDPPERRWLVEQWLPVGCVTILAGKGGAGKSRLALQLAAGVASGGGENFIWIPGEGPQLGEPGTVLYASWEDDKYEFARRLSEISGNDNPWVTPKQTTDLHFVDMAGHGPLWGAELGKHISSAGSLLPAGERLRELASELNPSLVIIDPLAAAYRGNENDRALVRDFMASWDAWAREFERSVLILAHQPKTRASTSGSTDWEAASRAVWTLGREKLHPDKKNKEEAWQLKVEKTNYGPEPAPLELGFDTGHNEARWYVVGFWGADANASNEGIYQNRRRNGDL